MKAFNQGISKAEFLAELKKHQAADAFARQTYGEITTEGKFIACAVGCSLESVSKLKGIRINREKHSEYEKHLGVPEWLAKLEDIFFENIPVGRTKTWPVEFAEAINEGANLELIKVPFVVYILEQNLITLNSLKVDAKHINVLSAIEQTKAATKQMIEAQLSGNKDDISTASSACSTAWSAADSTAWSTACSAAWSTACSAAWSATWSAASSASSACSTAWSAADSAARSARSARSASFDGYGDKLLELIRDCK